ncbi:protein piccolo-like [Frieseomelitta varia]|uniref:protein piccolo-like n=1 Tax=Frieseomelitta varia TaxID=561572 RepID=UPI001CB68805|nr:protein piccolo-like [Frieseomelitta varia]
MNRLKYVLGINVHRCVPSSKISHNSFTSQYAARLEQSIKGRHQSDVCVLSRSKEISDFRDSRYAGQTRNETTPTLRRGKNTSLERIVSEESVEERRDSRGQLKKSPNGERASGRIVVEESIGLTRKTKNLDVSRGTIEMEPRSYAQMIASYNDAMYWPNCSGVLKDNPNSSTINGIRRSPFSTASLVSLKWKNKPKGAGDTNSSASGLNVFSRDDDMIGNNNEVQKFLSYASMIERYSKAMDLGSVDNCDWHDNVVPKRYASTEFDEIPIILMSEKDANKKPIATTDEEIGDDQAEVEKNAHGQDGWLTKMDGTIKDLKRITAKADSDDKWMPQPAYWLDRVMNAHKKRIKDKREMLEKTSVKSAANKLANRSANRGTIVQDNEPTSNSETESVAASQRPDSTKPPASIPSASSPPASKPPSQDGPGSTPSIIDYIRRGPMSTSGSTNPTKEPQIELRMTPSQNESVVSINMDEEAARTTNGNKEQLSVVVSSKRDAIGKGEPRPDFSSMQISISETTIPVKQIEFSINGKPVSELKSIVARADKLDVLSSMDKVEIRIPSKNRTAEQSTNVVASSSFESKPVLKLQIAAKFNEPRFQQPRDTEMKTDPSHMPPPTAPVTPTPPTPPAPPVKPPRPHSLFRREPTESGATANETKKDGPSNALIAKQVENAISQRDVRASSTPRDEKISSTNVAVFQNSENRPSNSDANAPDRQSQQPAMNNEEKNRIPSNAIPWWSSEDSFKKIRKKGNTPTKSTLESNNAVPFVPVQASPSVKDSDEEKLTTDVSIAGSPKEVGPTKVDTRREDVVPKRPVVEETKRDDPDPIVNYVRAESSPQWVPLKHASETTPTKHSSGVTKRPRYRARSNLHDREATEKESDVPTISRIRYDGKLKSVSKIEKKPVAVRGPGSQIGKANVQSSNAICKKEGKLSANESADVSARGEKKRSGTDGTVEKNLLVKSIDESHPRIKEILKSMKPIEKREDGTLIDYGVIVPSRKPSKKVTEIPRIQTKASIENTATKKENREKIVEPEKVSSTKKKTLTELKNVVEQSKVVEPEKIRSVNKLAKFDVETKYETNKPRIGSIGERAMNEKKKEEKLKIESAYNGDRLEKRLISTEESSAKGTRSNDELLKSSDTNVKSSLLDKSKNTLPGSSVTPDETKASEKKEPKNTLKSAEQKKAPLETTIVGPSNNILDKTAPPLMGTINFPGSQKSGDDAVKSDNTPSKELPTGSRERQRRKNTNETGVSPFEGTIQLRPSTNRDNLVRLTGIDKEKVSTELTDQGDDSAKPSNKGGGGRGSSSPAAISEPPITYLKERLGQSIETEDKNGKKVGEYVLTDEERPEKNILYSSWLQRFKQNFHGDKTI